MRPGSASTWSGLQQKILPRIPATLGQIWSNAGDVFGFNWEIFNSFVAHHFVELSVGWVAGHGLCLACCDGVLDVELGETFIALANSLDHCHGCFGLHVNVWESAAYSVFFTV